MLTLTAACWESLWFCDGGIRRGSLILAQASKAAHFGELVRGLGGKLGSHGLMHIIGLCEKGYGVHNRFNREFLSTTLTLHTSFHG